MKFLIIANNFFNIVNFRIDLINKIKTEFPECKIILLAKFDGYEEQIIAGNPDYNLFNLKINPRSMDLKSNFITFFYMLYVFLITKPKLVISYTVKPNFFCCIFKYFFNFKLIANITGLGELYLNKHKKNKFIFSLYGKFLKKSNKIICQNRNDLNTISNMVSDKKKFHLILGSGVNRDNFKFKRIKSKSPIKVTFIGRIIKEKGIIEFLKAIIKFNKIYPNRIIFTIIGSKYDHNSKFNTFFSHLLKLSKATYINQTSNIYKFIVNSHFVILPSYREGLSKVLLESLTVGRPIIASSVPGCMELIKNNHNGFILKNISYLNIYDILRKLIKLDFSKIDLMGKNAYINTIIYSEKKVNQQYISLIRSTLY